MIEDIKKKFVDSLKKQSTDIIKDGIRFQQCLHNSSYEDCEDFGDDGFEDDDFEDDIVMDLDNEE